MNKLNVRASIKRWSTLSIFCCFTFFNANAWIPVDSIEKNKKDKQTTRKVKRSRTFRNRNIDRLFINTDVNSDVDQRKNKPKRYKKINRKVSPKELIGFTCHMNFGGFFPYYQQVELNWPPQTP